MDQSPEELAELAEGIANDHFNDGKVNLEQIAEENEIQIVRNDYGSEFLGTLLHKQNRFYIALNTNPQAQYEIGRLRFTFAHELGHFFIDAHRILMQKGISLTLSSGLDPTEYKKIEQEANLFASHLLMPRDIFCATAHEHEIGMKTILNLKTKFGTSIYCTTKHYLELDISKSIMIKWHSDFSLHYAQYSPSFSLFTGISRKPPVKLSTEYLKSICTPQNLKEMEFIECACPMSRWIYTIAPGSKEDALCLEQTIKLGDYGGLTLITF